MVNVAREARAAHKTKLSTTIRSTQTLRSCKRTASNRVPRGCYRLPRRDSRPGEREHFWALRRQQAARVAPLAALPCRRSRVRVPSSASQRAPGLSVARRADE
jgi:hypothetical protein